MGTITERKEREELEESKGNAIYNVCCLLELLLE